ncbi:MAG TPA: bifunctional serine/threonine-protein kinase/formylglycine-generating enzyme family protein, partial [Patescibacteria group bacterium]|nr:bifunctional serine/threonine-protein kinase/formylglycine-generating enzyme family protein [Patescibacteria group bacterium]
SLDRPVAIKVVHFRGSGSDQMAVRFEHEARTIARLEHPGIVGIYEVGRTRDGAPYYSMAYLPNGDLSHAAITGREETIAAVLRAIASALGFAHAQGVVHRDVKPDNVLFDREQRARLADFGISRSLGSVRVTTTGDALGSSAYMSPEQARGLEVDARSDLYSLGVMAYELLTGDLPFRGSDAVSMALAHHTDPVPRLPAKFERWQGLIDRALAKVPDDRCQSADEFIAMLDRIAQSALLNDTTVVSGVAATAAAPVRKSGQRTWMWAAAGAAIVVALAAWLSSRRDEATPSASAGTVAIPASVTDPALALIADRIAAQRWFEPKQGSASALLAVALAEQRNDERLDAADTFIGTVRGSIMRALDESRDVEAVGLIRPLRDFIAAHDLKARESSLAFESALVEALAARLAVAEQGGDPLPVEALAAMFEADAALAARWQKLAANRRAGQSLRDLGGPPMRVLRVGDAWLAMAEHEVTRIEYGRFVAATRRASQQCRQLGAPLTLVKPRTWREPGFKQDGEHPVVCVSYDDARAYAAWLSQQTGRKYRLPSASEWRVAAAGVATAGSACRLGNVYARDGRDFNMRERHDCTDGAEDTRSVRGFPASAQGLFDLVGNVAEWVGDCAARGACEERKIMGSSYRDGANAPLLGLHDTQDGDKAALDVGFRVVREM